MSTELVADMLGAGDFALPLEQTCIRWGIDTALRKSHFLGQVAVESARFTTTRESLNYSVEGLLNTFERHRISAEDCQKYGRLTLPDGRIRPADQQSIANIVYGGDFGRKNLGNVEPGDGWKFRGRGLKQVTGRYNYLKCSLALFGDDRLLSMPELLEALPHAAQSAGWFWAANGLNDIAQSDSVEAVTRKVNGGLNGLADRKDWTLRAKQLFESLLVDPYP